jgi:hypothetical protein
LPKSRPAAPRVAPKTVLLAGLLALALTGCGGQGTPVCRVDDTGDQMISTRGVFLERLAGCPIGGRR